MNWRIPEVCGWGGCGGRLMGPCVLGKDNLNRPKKWSDWKKDAENKMRFLGRR